MAKRKHSRRYLSIGSLALLAALLAFAFWPKATLVDIGTVTRGPMQLTIDEEGRTRVRNNYVVSAPAAGQLQRLEVEAGDRVVRGQTIVARVQPSPLDPRSHAQANAGVDVANANLRAAREEAAKAAAEQKRANASLAREQRLWKLNSTSRDALDTAQRDARDAAAAVQAGNAAIAARRAELDSARAELLGSDTSMAILAPVSGTVLKVIQQSEVTLAAGAAIMEIGDTEGDLEVLVELLSTDAVQVTPGNTVMVEDWGGPGVIMGKVDRVEPRGFTKTSALGVEEQRVNTIVRLAGSGQDRRRLGSGFRVLARIIVWQDPNATIVPSGALFRQQGDWMAFVVSGGRAERRPVQIGRNNGTQAEVVAGLNKGEQVVLYPAAELTDGAHVEQRHAE